MNQEPLTTKRYESLGAGGYMTLAQKRYAEMEQEITGDIPVCGCLRFHDVNWHRYWHESRSGRTQMEQEIIGLWGEDWWAEQVKKLGVRVEQLATIANAVTGGSDEVAV